MAISLTLLDTNTAASSSTIATSTSVSPSGVIVFAVLVAHVKTSTQPTISSISGCGLTWSQVTFVNGDASGTDRQSTFLWKGEGTPSSGTITATVNASTDFLSLQIIDGSGIDTTTPVVQSATNTANGATTITVTLAAFADATNNVAFGAWGVQNITANNITAGTGFTELAETSNNHAHVSSEWKTGEDTSVDWSISGGTTYRSGAFAVELKQGGASTQTVTCNVLAATSTILSPTVINTQEIVFDVLNATSTIFSPTVDYNVELDVITTTSTLFNPTVVPGNAILTCDLLTTSSTVFNLTVVPGAVSVAFPLINATSTVLDPGSEMILQLDVMNTTSTIHSPALDYNVDLAVLNTSSTIFQPVLMHNLELDLLATTSTIYGPDLNQDISIPVVNAAETVISPGVSSLGGAQTIDLQLVGDDSTIFSPSLYETITVPVLNVPGTVESPSTKYTIGLQVVSTSSTIFTPSLEYLIEMQTVNTAPTVLAPLVGDVPPDTGSSGMVKTHNPSPFPIGL